ncbi:DNA repair helicase RAD25, putative [Plasmodium berghei]|uniref:DNA 3'-5' helicase n=2 Tax=Plasmodium berghei TaxID=5821 RepID=A0A509AG49_PLABA|nr:TFIIH basal transcription factor complex helicase XPB subunit, putative [Plasmodium berghei ANKA]CXI12418.1 DNA repair helicase RAD25, putative [Plasmodium berghei]SCL93351.1 DNA repair helicase RAD25, putative [Plasmodium berghei]SCM15842.1 DNA repair helicase RAD25, putative [Plasmodium berghei]SCM17637.1 DNA repair helicase RAD25, putative [Plasmodium berghei]SCN23154.1 DNA repair helicase RAD25, putative [Plasmodium berghei]|eukprot:XP_034420446.1 TFIIH basal transcription factor complex helicase XPB subunit, putative [Plasmodium berghei ANKA]
MDDPNDYMYDNISTHELNKRSDILYEDYYAKNAKRRRFKSSEKITEENEELPKKGKRKLKEYYEVLFDNKIINLPFSADSINVQQRGFHDYSKEMKLKKNHMNKPLWICSDGFIYLEMFNSCSKQASDFLITIAEPICRPEIIHEFQLTIFSLYAAISVGITLDELLLNLDKFSKNILPSELVYSIKKSAESFGKVKLVLRENKYYIEAKDKFELDYLLNNNIIKNARVYSKDVNNSNNNNSKKTTIFSLNNNFMENSRVDNTGASSRNILNEEVENKKQKDSYVTYEAPVLDTEQLGFKISESEKQLMLEETKKNGNDNSNENSAEVYSFEVNCDKIEEVKQEALQTMQRPLLMEYDFRRDKKNPNLNCSLKNHVQIRYYQEKALRKMFSNGRSRSGIIVLPCGVGKTLTGITAASTIKKSSLFLTTSAVAVEQWKKQFEDFTNIHPRHIRILTSDYKFDLWPINEAGVLISTYTMLAYSGKRSEQSLKIVNDIRRREWGLLVFDEVQFAPAPSFRRINDIVKSHCKLGLTATLVREDLLIRDLQWIIGPKLYEANWVELQNKGFLAKALCKEIWCSMPSSFYKYYLKSNSFIKRRLYTCNPRKLMMCEYLIKYHEQNNDKIIVFSDNIFALLHIAKTLNKPFIYGKLSPIERIAIINKFKNDSTINTILLSKVGDNAIDIPIANVVIQISFNFASRRQEAQRLGRIIRPKNKANEKKNINDPDSFFYSLVSKDTIEMCYSDKRQRFLINQGYAYNVLSDNIVDFNKLNLVYKNKKIQDNLLKCILASTDDGNNDEDDDAFDDMNFKKENPKTNKRNNSVLSSNNDNLVRKSDSDGLLKLSTNMDITFNDKKKNTSKKFADKHILFRKFLNQNR